MPRTRVNRREAATPNGEQAEARPEDSRPVLLVAERPDVQEAQRKLAEGEEALTAAAKRVSEITEAVEGARDRLRELEKLLVLDEVSIEEVEATRRDLARLEPKLAEAQAVARSWRDATEDLTNRLERARERARREVEAGLNERRGEIGRRLVEGLVALEPFARELFLIERAAREQGFSLPGDWSLALLELVNVEAHRPVTNPDYVFAYHPADGSLLVEYLRRLKKIGVAVEPPEAVSLNDLLGGAW